MLGKEFGSGQAVEASSRDALFAKAKAIMASKNVNIDAAMKEARAENPELAAKFDQEQKESN